MKPQYAKSVLEKIQSEENYHENLRKISDKQSCLYGVKKIGEPRELTVKDKRKIYSDIVKYYSDNSKIISCENQMVYIFHTS